MSIQLPYKQNKSGLHSLTLSSTIDPGRLCDRFIFEWNLAATAVKNPKETSCSTKPPIAICSPVLLFIMSLACTNIVAPALWVRKENKSKPTKILVTHVSETPEAFGLTSEE